MKTAFSNDASSLLLISLIVFLCRCQSSSSSFAPPPLPSFRSPPLGSRRRSRSRPRATGTVTSSTAAAAAVVVFGDIGMTPSSSSGVDEGDVAIVLPDGRGKTKYPNWRVVDPRRAADDDDDDGPIRSPFCHHRHHSPSTTSDDDDDQHAQAAASSAAAPWSKSAYLDSLELYDKIMGMTDPAPPATAEGGMGGGRAGGSMIASMAKRALHDVGSIYRLYGPQCTIGSYNGGKDACVALHLMRAAHADYCRNIAAATAVAAKGGDHDDDDDDGDIAMIPRPRVIYFQHADEFPEVLSLLHDTVIRFDLDMIAFEMGVSYVEGLRYLVERNIVTPEGICSADGTIRNEGRSLPLPPRHPLAFVLGTRRDDPNAGTQGVYAPSSSYMPPFLRCNPIIDWDYGNVWEFLRHETLRGDLPYCPLYDMGYTSLGTVKDTLPCPALLRENAEEEKSEGKKGTRESYWPAYMLKDWGLERAGRIDKKDLKPSTATTEGSHEVSIKLAKNEKDNGLDRDDETETETENDTATLTESMSTLFLDNDSKSSSGGGSVSIATTREISARSSSSLRDRALFSSPSWWGRRPSVGLIVIGDEILKGMTPDSNIVVAAKALRSHNVSLARVSVISDNMDDIVNEIRRFVNDEENIDVIVTSGGVGPTHDDVTIKSVAEALGLSMEMNKEMAELLLEKMGSESAGISVDIVSANGSGDEDPMEALTRRLSVGQRKMATLPTSSVLHYLASNYSDHDCASTSNEWPILECQNIFILPGVPSYFEKKMKQLASYIPGIPARITRDSLRDESIGLSLDRSAHLVRQASEASPPPRGETYRIVLALKEDEIVSALNAAVAAHPYVTFGSYPLVLASDEDASRTIITLEGRFCDNSKSSYFSKAEMDKNVETALEDLKSNLPEEGIVCVDAVDDLMIK
ncbi:hypothetical protein ACHAXA_006232 [Cyclostephanos tholiformis]|uniref:FAD synthase n=1 Tax=Cyclostephanos tholiformis TaxID=382380 RepID=A0ABD3SEZ9_9STRA